MLGHLGCVDISNFFGSDISIIIVLFSVSDKNLFIVVQLKISYIIVQFHIFF